MIELGNPKTAIRTKAIVDYISIYQRGGYKIFNMKKQQYGQVPQSCLKFPSFCGLIRNCELAPGLLDGRVVSSEEDRPFRKLSVQQKRSAMSEKCYAPQNGQRFSKIWF